MNCVHELGSSGRGRYVCLLCKQPLCGKDLPDNSEWCCLLDADHEGPCRNSFYEDELIAKSEQ